MNQNDFEKTIKEQIDISLNLLTKKGKEYSRDEIDRFAVFKRAAAIQHCSPKEALCGMMAKHTVSVYDLCRSETEIPLELWTEKITDSINYLLILKAMIAEEKND